MYCEGMGKYSELARLLQFCFVPSEGKCKIEEFEPLRFATKAYYSIYNDQDPTHLLRQLSVNKISHPFLFKFCEILKQQNNNCSVEKSNHCLFLVSSGYEETVLFEGAIVSIRLTVLESYLDDVISDAFESTDSALKELGLVDVACAPELGERVASKSTDAIIAWANSHGMERGYIGLDMFARFIKLAMLGIL